MGVEPTDAGCSPPPTDFEDQGRHRATFTPAMGNICHIFTRFTDNWQISAGQTHLAFHHLPGNKFPG